MTGGVNRFPPVGLIDFSTGDGGGGAGVAGGGGRLRDRLGDGPPVPALLLRRR